jgi:hypothetical protein
MKPFDLKAALAGKPVIDQRGREVFIAGYNPLATVGQRVVGWIRGASSGGCDLAFRASANGMSTVGIRLGMATVKHVAWVNIHSKVPDSTQRAFVYDTEEEANLKAGLARVACVRIEWEE